MARYHRCELTPLARLRSTGARHHFVGSEFKFPVSVLRMSGVRDRRRREITGVPAVCRVRPTGIRRCSRVREYRVSQAGARALDQGLPRRTTVWPDRFRWCLTWVARCCTWHSPVGMYQGDARRRATTEVTDAFASSRCLTRCRVDPLRHAACGSRRATALRIVSASRHRRGRPAQRCR